MEKNIQDFAKRVGYKKDKTFGWKDAAGFPSSDTEIENYFNEIVKVVSKNQNGESNEPLR